MGEHRIIAPAPMTFEAFVEWGADHETRRYELLDGVPVAMGNQTRSHNRVIRRTARALEDAIAAADRPCEVFSDALVVRIDSQTGFIPDVLVECGVEDDGSVISETPVIVIEVISQSSRRIDLHRKLEGYFRVQALVHYLVLDPENRVVIHHARDGETIRTRILHDGPIALDPPGLTLDHADLFIPEPAP